jgi:hypothetical protein
MWENDVPKAKTKPRYVPNRLGKDQLIDDSNHLYNCDKKQGERTFWICSEKRTQHCLATASVVKTEMDGMEVEYVTYRGQALVRGRNQTLPDCLLVYVFYFVLQISKSFGNVT